MNQKIRNQVKLADLSAEYAISQDALSRHKRYHLKAPSSANVGTLAEKWHQIFDRADEIFRSSNLLGDGRAALEALAQQARALEASQRAQDAQQSGGFESLSVPEQIHWIMANSALYRAVLDRIVADCRLPQTHGQEADSLESLGDSRPV